jgi:DNA-binding SARP family transcriptional activator/CheY-like chemotaxis protein
MNQKQQVLIVDSQEEWLRTLQQALPAEQFSVQTARTYDEAVAALQQQGFALAVVEPVMEGQNGHNGLTLLTRIAINYPDTRVIVVSGTMGRELLRNSADLPTNLPLLQKQQWDEEEFISIVSQVLKAEKWGPEEPQIEMPTDAANGSTENGEHSPHIQWRYAGLTGPLVATGMTGPLSTGLIPPRVGTRTGMPRVLIVERDQEWQHRLASLMENQGYFWRVASDYEQAMDRLRLETFHIVMLDLMIGEHGISMKQGKGWPLLEYLINECPKTNVIVSSGHVSKSDLARLFMTYPIKGFVDKDAYTPEELLEAIQEQLAGPSLRIQTLGGFRIWRDEKVITQFADHNAEQLIKILITRRGENVSVEELIECLWPGTDVNTQVANLGAIISNARMTLEPDLPRPGDSHFILRAGANYVFNTMGNVEVDVEQIRRLVSEGRQHERHAESEEALKAYEAACALYQGDFLPDDRSQRWSIQERNTLQALFTTALNRIADIHAADNQLDLAIKAANRSLQIDAYNESTYRRLMRYHACNGDQNSAMMVYRNLVKLFSEFFGEEPNPMTTNLHRDIEAGRDVGCIEAASGSGEWRLTEL